MITFFGALVLITLPVIILLPLGMLYFVKSYINNPANVLNGVASFIKAF